VTGRIFKVEAEGIDELQRDLKRAGAAADDFKAANRAIGDLVAQEGRREVPVRSGLLRSTIRGESTTRQAIIAAGTSGVPYAGPIHFGWPTRGLGSGRDKQQLIGALGSKGSRSLSDRALRRAANQQNRRRGKVRGGPIPPNPFLYRALDQRIDNVMDEYDKRVDAIAKAVESGSI
jgi:hypothetical protein